MKRRNIFTFMVVILTAWLCQSSMAYALEKDGITYTTDKENGTATVTACETSVTGAVVIPEMVNGYRVTAIGSSAFGSCDQITSIKVPDAVTTIEHHAFWNCENLTDISLPAYMEEIEHCAFIGCVGLTEIELPIGITEFGDHLFSNTSLREVHIPYTIKEINPWAFSRTGTLKKLVFYGPNVDIPSDLDLTDESYNRLTVAIEGLKGSTAESYAQQNKYEFTEIDESHVHTYRSAVKQATFKKTGWIKEVCICGNEKSSTKLYCPRVTYSDIVFEYDGTEKQVAVTVKDTKGNEIDPECYEVIYPKKSVEIGKYSITVRFKKNYVGKSTCNYRIVEKINLKKPANVKLELQKYNSIKLTWGKVTGADGYRVYYKKDGAAQYKIANIKGTSMIRDSLYANTKYIFKIVPYLLCNNTFVESSNYVQKSIKTLHNLKAPNVTVSLANVDTIKVSWKKVNNAAGYYVYYKKPSAYTIIVNGHEVDDVPYKLYKTTTATSIQMKDVGYGQKYYIKVQPYGVSNGKKLKSNNAASTIITTLKKLSAPSKVTVSSTAKTKVKVAWKKVTNAKGYYVYLKKSSAKAYSLYKTTTKTSLNISNLKQKTKYQVKIVPYSVRNGVKVKGDCYITKKFTK